MPINASNALTLAHQLRVYTAEAANFSDMVDVLYVAQMIEKFLGYVDQIKQVRVVGPGGFWAGKAGFWVFPRGKAGAPGRAVCVPTADGCDRGDGQ